MEDLVSHAVDEGLKLYSLVISSRVPESFTKKLVTTRVQIVTWGWQFKQSNLVESNITYHVMEY